ncbi:ABC transporter ATP-binding protein [Aminipila butyrica]|uniref:ABC transporter ATP-binding protein n=1 Tax=Aminipila butyrica TaxID=433296 RepID=A0A858BQ71_9FIRM|nr:ABC transporter ATP-binding protein [Aminipila butyrica]QIB68011.1 ABC transporter ATP-binding protein [Aminipila butyrica]
MFKEENLILSAKQVTKKFAASKDRSLVACDKVSLNFYKGKTLGLVGESGCGKSTFMRMMVQLEKPTAGNIFFHGKEVTELRGEALRQHRRRIQMVFQDPASAFNPKMKIKDIICEPLINYGLIKRRERDQVARKYLQMVELDPELADRYPHNLSGGQQQRIGIARALTLEPEVIICDESTSALDVSVQKSIVDLLHKLQQEKHISIGFICHDIALVSQVSDHIAVMYLGNVVEVLEGKQMAEQICHPYSKTLMDSIFHLGMDYGKKMAGLEGEMPSALELPPGCPFQSRCSVCVEKCQTEKPDLKKLGEGHYVACHAVRGA